MAACLATARAEAQRPHAPSLVPAPADSAERCDSARLTTPVGTEELVLHASLHRDVPIERMTEWMAEPQAERLPRDFADLALEEIRTHLAWPRPLVLPVFGRGCDIACPAGRRARPPSVDSAPAAADTVAPTFAVEVGFTLHRSGPLTGLAIRTSSVSPDIDAAVLRAIRAVDSARAFPAFLYPSLQRLDSLPLRLSLGFGNDTTGASREVARFTLPRYAPLRPAWPLPGNVPPPYPAGHRLARRDGDVLVQFVIDETGRPEPDSYRILRMTAWEFGAVVARQLAGYRFTPARLAGCPVRQLVQMPFQFRINP